MLPSDYDDCGTGHVISRCLEVLDDGDVLFMVTGISSAGETVLHQLHAMMRNALMTPAHTDAWVINANTCALSLKLPYVADNPQNIMHVNFVCERMIQECASHSELGAECKIIPVGALRAAADMRRNIDELNALLDIIVHKRLETRFQPIINLQDGHIFGYEALIRGPKGTDLYRPMALFDAAEHGNMVAWFDMACLEQAFLQASQLGLKHKLFVNVEAEGLEALCTHDRPIGMRARESGMRADQIVIEITERQTLDDFPRLMDSIRKLREEGFRIAVDDAGAGYNSLQLIAELHPDFVKIDRALVRSLDVNGPRRGLLGTLVRYCRQIGTSILCEGAETWEELSTLIDIGVQYGQGYLIGRPSETFRGVNKVLREQIEERAAHRLSLVLGRTVCAGTIMRAGRTVHRHESMSQVLHYFHKEESLTSVVVVEEQVVQGIIMRSTLDYLLTQTGHIGGESSLAEEEAAGWMQTNVVKTAQDTTLEEMPRLLARHSGISLDTDVIVIAGGETYCGIIPVRTILESLAVQQQFGARYSDSLSGLPNRVVLEKLLETRLASQTPVGLIRVDLMYLEQYNKCFGNARGDELIKALAETVQQVVAQDGNEENVVTHFGGDDFVVLTTPDKVGDFCRGIASGFAHFSRQYYPFENIKSGYMTMEQNGRTVKTPLCVTAIAGLTGKTIAMISVAQALNELHSLLQRVQSRSEGGIQIEGEASGRKAA